MIYEQQHCSSNTRRSKADEEVVGAREQGQGRRSARGGGGQE
jgi:hypothetical protein